MRYTCEKAIEQRWFERARDKRLDKADKYLDISYDLRQPNFIYIIDIDGRGFKKCFLIDSEDRYFGKSIEEIEYLHESERRDSKVYEADGLQHDVDLATAIENIVDEAKERSEQHFDETLSNAKKVASIRNNRAFERAELRKEQTFELGETAVASDDIKGMKKETKPEELVAEESKRPNYLSLLKRMKREAKDGESR